MVAHYQDHKPPLRGISKGLFKQERQKSEGSSRNTLQKKKPLSEIICCRCDNKGHFTWSCTAKTLHVQVGTEKISLLGEEVNGQPIRRIKINSGASRTVVNRSYISPTNITEESIVVTFDKRASGKYSLTLVRGKIVDKECCMKPTIVQDLAEEVLLVRDISLHKRMVKSLPRKEQMELLCQLV